jgi:hypothetical protein
MVVVPRAIEADFLAAYDRLAAILIMAHGVSVCLLLFAFVFAFVCVVRVYSWPPSTGAKCAGELKLRTWASAARRMAAEP